MAQALENHAPGRPPDPLDAEKEELQRKVRDLEKKLYLAEKTIEVKDCFGLRSSRAKKTKRKTAEGREEAIRKVIEILGSMKENTGVPYAVIAARDSLTLGPVAAAEKENHPFLNRPGPRSGAVRSCHFGGGDLVVGPWLKRRTGATKLYGRYQGSLSRPFRMVGQVRQEVTADHRKNLRRIDWLVPGWYGLWM
jgi:hypothetical protein